MIVLDQINYLLIAISFLTIIPIKTFARPEKSSLGNSMAYFPIVGLIMGGLGAVLSLALDQVMPTQASNVLIILFFVVITGGLHLDGLADTVDAIASGQERRGKLKVMKDGAIGPMGVAAVTIVLLLQFIFLNNLTATPRLLAIIVVPAIARWPMVLLLWRLPAARKDGLAHIFTKETRFASFLISSLFTLVIIAGASYMLGWANLLIIPILILIAVFAAKVFRYFFGGTTGDTLGATVELSAAIIFLAISLLSTYA